jgi:hypothetical protein
MPIVKDVVEAISERVGVPGQTATVAARALREAGRLSQSGRGTSAAQATMRDAASVLITLVEAARPSHAVKTLVEFGDRLVLDRSLSKLGRDGAVSAYLLADGETFLDGVTRLLMGTVDPALVALRRRHAQHRMEDGSILMGPKVAVTIRENELTAEIEFCGARLYYTDLSRLDRRASSPDWRTRHRIGIETSKHLADELLIDIAKIVAGEQ